MKPVAGLIPPYAVPSLCADRKYWSLQSSTAVRLYLPDSALCLITSISASGHLQAVGTDLTTTSWNAAWRCYRTCETFRQDRQDHSFRRLSLISCRFMGIPS